MAETRKKIDEEFQRGQKMKPGKGWRLVSQTGLRFKATLIKRMKVGKENIALFRISVPQDK
jgi:hypothetical protein